MPCDTLRPEMVEACRYGHVDVVRLLLADSRVNPADCNNEAISETVTV